MRVLVDTSVWSLSLRERQSSPHPLVEKLEAILRSDEDVFLTGLILQEVLQAFRSDATFARVARHLEPFPVLEMARSDYVLAASLHRICASKGVSASTSDCQVAAAAITHGCLLLSADQDFQRIARLSDLQLA